MEAPMKHPSSRFTALTGPALSEYETADVKASESIRSLLSFAKTFRTLKGTGRDSAWWAV